MDARQQALLASALLKSELRRYRPHPKQSEFHALGGTKRERALLAANQSGKSKCASMELAIHTTGRYPEWWTGKRWRSPTRWWASGPSAEATRDNPQRLLLGDPYGTGSLPEASIAEVRKSRSISGGVDTIRIRHKSGGISTIGFRNYAQEVDKWSGATLEGIWFDEEPPLELYMEGLTRTNATRGIIMLTATPLLGMTQVVLMFYPRPESEDRSLTQMTIDDALHYTEEDRQRVIRSYPAWQREARVKGIPMLGRGRVFQIEESEIAVEPFAIPQQWGRIGGIDFGVGNHPTAAVECAYDRDSDVFYVFRCYKHAEAVLSKHSMTLRKWGDALPWAWPHDGHVQDRSSGKPVADLYRQDGLRMIREHATFQGGGYGLEAGIGEMEDRMETQRFKVFRTLDPWFEEFRLYHRKPDAQGRPKVVKNNDDLMSATRYALMMKRFSRPAVGHGSGLPRFTGHYDPLAGQRERYEAIT